MDETLARRRTDHPTPDRAGERPVAAVGGGRTGLVIVGLDSRGVGLRRSSRVLLGFGGCQLREPVRSRAPLGSGRRRSCLRCSQEGFSCFACVWPGAVVEARSFGRKNGCRPDFLVGCAVVASARQTRPRLAPVRRLVGCSRARRCVAQCSTERCPCRDSDTSLALNALRFSGGLGARSAGVSLYDLSLCRVPRACAGPGETSSDGVGVGLGVDHLLSMPGHCQEQPR